jgi:hypothetical protein
MVTTWLGKTFSLKDGDEVIVRDVHMTPSHKVNLTLQGRSGSLYLTTEELARNIA